MDAAWLREVQLELVDVAPTPRLTRLDGPHDRMLGRVKVLGRVLILRGIAAADVPAFQAQSQMDPGVANLEALLASARVGLDVLDLVEVSALSHAFKVASRVASYRCGYTRTGSANAQDVAGFCLFNPSRSRGRR